MAKDNNNNNPIANLLFDGIVYKFISAPHLSRTDIEDVRTFLNLASNYNLEEKIKSVQSAIEVVDQIKDKNGVFSALEAFLDGNLFGLILYDEEYKVLFENRIAQQIANTLKIFCPERRLDPSLRSQIEKALITKNNDSSKIVPIKLNLEKSTNIYLARGVGMANSDHRLNILLIPPTQNSEMSAYKELAVKYKLSKRETALLSRLIEGLSLKEISKEFSVSVNTLRTQLKAIFNKTDTNSQSALIRLFLNRELKIIDSLFNQSESSTLSNIASADLFFTTNLGNKICFRDYGPKNGRPIVVCHSVMGSRFNIPHNHSEILLRHNRRVIIADQPGYGKSDQVKNHYRYWSEYFDELLSHLKLKEVELLGSVYGCSQALEIAKLNPKNVTRVILASPTFINTISQQPLLGTLIQVVSKVANKSRKVHIEIYKLWVNSMKYDPENYIQKMVSSYSGSAEQELIKDPLFIKQLALNLIESQRNNSKGAVENSAFSLTPRNIDLASIQIPFDIWVGDEDRCITVEGAKKICAPLPNKTFHIREGHGEDIYYHLFEEIVQ
ncbi:MAG: alpha/beta fold hydrolase [Acidiferrobacterales bacterium]|nr:alpha/beta fold hydrolase [Acidiferrobacterales bacterium]